MSSLVNKFITQILMLLILGALITWVSFWEWGNDTTLANHSRFRYEAVIDAGSTGTRIYLYRYNSQHTNDPAKLDVKLLYSQTTQPGLSSMINNPSRAFKQLKRLIHNAKAKVPASSRDQTKLSIYATAGMRLKSITEQQQLYQYLTSYLQEQKLVQLRAIRTISGQWEGIFDWLSVNYLNDSLQPKQTVAAMDMGGASTQLAFEARDSDPNQVMTLKLGTYTFPVHSRSFLGLGMNQARYQFTNHQACFYQDYNLPDGKHGTGDANQCQKAIAPLINDIHKVYNSIIAVPKNQSIIALSGYQYTTDALDEQTKGKLTVGDYNRMARHICQLHWNHLTQTYPQDSDRFRYCFDSNLIYTLLHTGYGLADDRQLIATNTIDNTPVDWTLGVVIYHALDTNQQRQN
jgi:Golgi nucleoside diphosphatase